MDREARLLQLGTQSGETRRVLARAQHLTIEHVMDRSGTAIGFASTTEIIVLLPSVGAAISGDGSAQAPGHSVAILAAGSYELKLAAPGEAYILATDRIDRAQAEAMNAEMYAEPDARVRPVGTPFPPARPLDRIRVYPVEDIAIPPDNGRLRFLQSETMSLNWVEYQGQRGRDALSPHSHVDFEQISLAIEGSFLHHLRTPWGRNADLWREDAHLAASAGSIVIIPPEIIHTTEGVGGGRHILVDIFAPPRSDFIAKNWVFNAEDYASPLAVVA